MGSTSCVLVGHDVLDDAAPTSHSEAGVSASSQLILAAIEELEADGFRFVALKEFLASRNRQRVALLTFDDGYRSLPDRLIPRLCERRVPAVVFLVAENLELAHDAFPIWLFSLRDARAGLSAEQLALLERAAGVARVLRRTGDASLRDLLGRSHDQVYRAFHDELGQAELDGLAEIVAAHRMCPRLTLTRDDVARMRASGLVEFGAHSLTHRPFAELTHGEIEREVNGSCESLARLLGCGPGEVAFAYPYGAVTPWAERVVRDRCVAGFTSGNRWVVRLDRNSSLPRVNLDRVSLERARSASPASRYRALLLERARLRVRYGSTWRFVGPLRRALAPQREHAGAKETRGRE